jgi:hypothetical protein
MEDEGNGRARGDDRDDALVRALADALRRADPVPAEVVAAAKQAFAPRRRTTAVEEGEGEPATPLVEDD